MKSHLHVLSLKFPTTITKMFCTWQCNVNLKMHFIAIRTSDINILGENIVITVSANNTKNFCVSNNTSWYLDTSALLIEV